MQTPIPSVIVNRFIGWALILFLAPAAWPQVFTTTPQFSNPVKPANAQAAAFATLASGANFATNGRPSEISYNRFKIDSWTAGMPFPAAAPDFNFGDVITPPPLADKSRAPTVLTPNGAFYMAARNQLVASQAGICTVMWTLTDGTSKTIHYNIGSVPVLAASRLFWTDNYAPGGVNTNFTSVPDNTAYAVSLNNIYAKIHYNTVVPDFDTADSQSTSTGQSARSAKAISDQGLPAVWIDDNSLLRARFQSGYFILEYFDTPTFDNSVGYEVVYVGPARVYQSSVVLGDRLLPSEGAGVAAGLSVSTSKASGYVVQWTVSQSHFSNFIFATAVNSDSTQFQGDSSKTQLLWQRIGNLGIVWPYEAHWYAITWPGDDLASLFVYDPANPSGSPPINIPTNYTASIVWSEKPDTVLKSDSDSSSVIPLGEGRALIQYQNNQDVWFVPVRVVARTNGAYVSNQEVNWPVGMPLQPVKTQPLLQLDGVENYLGFSSALQPGFTTELWIHPSAVTNNQTLVALLDYPQQATLQSVLSLAGNLLRLSIYTNGSATISSMVLTSSNSIPPGVWTHVAFVKSPTGSIQLFINGDPDVTGSVSVFNAQPPNSVTYAQVNIGQGLPVGGAAVASLAPFAGEIKEVRLWKSAIDSTTLRKNMSAQLKGGELNLDHLITSSRVGSGTPYDGIGSASFQVADLAQGSDVNGYGALNTVGPLPFTLNQRLSFAASANWAEVPISWNTVDARTIEFWVFVASASTSQALLASVVNASTNLQVGISAGHLTMAMGKGPVLDGTGVISENSSHHIAISASGSGSLAIYLDGVQQGLVASNSDSLAYKLLLGTGFVATGYSNLTGEFRDFRVYSGFRSTSQISSDMSSSVNLSDSSLIRYYNFDQIVASNTSDQIVYQIPDLARGYPATYHGNAALGSSLSLSPKEEVSGGIVRLGTAYQPAIYSRESRIIPVNNTPTNSLIEVWWKVPYQAPYLTAPLEIPGEVTRYRLMDPIAPPILVVAGQNKGGFPVQSTWSSATLYYQNDPTSAGYNPNEEHGLIIGDAAYALRWDLNSDSTSHGYLLLQYSDPSRGGKSFLQPVAVVPTNGVYPTFDSQLLVGQLLQPPVPLIYLPNSSLSGPASGEDPLHRLFQDRQYAYWVQSANSGTPDQVPSRWFYPLQPGFYWPSSLGNKSVGDSVPFGNGSNGMAVHYTISWPSIVPTLALGQTLSDAVPSANGDGNLPAVAGQKSVEILFDEAGYSSKTSAVVVDPSTTSSAALSSLNGVNTATDVRQGKTYFTLLPPHLRNRVYWDPIAQSLNLIGTVVRPVSGLPYVLPAWLGSGETTNTDYYALSSLSSSPAWRASVDQLRKQANIISTAEDPFTEMVLTPTGRSGGHITLGINTRKSLNATGDPVSLYPVLIDTRVLYTGAIIVMYSDNQFDQYTTLRHSGDFGGDPSQYQFDWRYSAPDNGQVPQSDPATWISYTPVTAGLNRIIFGGPGLSTLKDEYFAVRWRCTAAGAPNTNWSGWTTPALVKSWLTRALDGINPFEQRVASLDNNSLDLTTSILSQAGKRYVGEVPLNRDNAVNYGLIETYETLLAQARNLSIDAGYSDVDVNNSLLNSASKLNELYNLLGDEALNDAKDPTIAWGSRDLNDIFFGSRASSLFAFQGLVPTLLEEELALLRGLDDTTSTPVTVYPVYNRLYWNFTKGVNSGEPAYALNYGIPSVVSNSNGSITEADAARLYPQGHGDAYGHYLTALKEYYRLLANTNFTWYPRAEVKTISGVNVTFDYVDERKMASTALQLGRTAEEIIDRTFRRDYRLDPTKRVPLYSDSNTNRAWSATEWCDRGSQGILYNWIILNSLLPGANPEDSSQTISRATVPELGQIAGLMGTLQDKQDDIDRGDSPMGVAANVVPFDLDPSLVDTGQSHFDQVYTRAVAAMQSAYAVFQRASESAANLRRQDVSLETFRYQIAQRENEFNAQLVDLYGSPYPDDIGPAGAYATGYQGPDLYHYNYIDRDLFSPADSGAVTQVSFAAQYSITGDNLDTLSAIGTNISYSINSDGIPLLPDSWVGQRAIYGKIQGALSDYVRAWISLRGAIALQSNHKAQLEARLQRLKDHNSYSDYYGAIDTSLQKKQLIVKLAQQGIDLTLSTLDTAESEIQSAYETSKDSAPQSFIAGLAAGGDLSFPARIGLGITKLIGDGAIGGAKNAGSLASYAAGKFSDMLGNDIAENQANLVSAEEQSQTTMETSMLLSTVNADRDSIYAASVAFRQSWQSYISLVAKGNQLQTDLLVFRQQNAARIQEARYADVIFRTFKNEDLEEYLSAFQQASRYVFASARVYDYETGLLDPFVVAGQDGDFMGDTMKATQLGDMVNGQPVPGSGGASSLASILSQMSANWSVLKGRFGINNPTRETHRISLRRELFRIGHSDDPGVEADNLGAFKNKLYTYRVPDIRLVPEFKNYCQSYSPMGTNEPALVIPFSTEISAGKNLFGLPLAGGDTVFDSAHFTTKIRGAAVSLVNYNKNTASSLTKTPRVYLLPAGVDRQRTPISGGISIRDWQVVDQVWPIPFPSSAGNVSLPLASIGTGNVHTIRRFPPMRAYDDDDLASADAIPYDSRLIGRSAWNTEWVLIIPGSFLSSSSSSALDNLTEGITDINLLLETYSYSGN